MIQLTSSGFLPFNSVDHVEIVQNYFPFLTALLRPTYTREYRTEPPLFVRGRDPGPAQPVWKCPQDMCAFDCFIVFTLLYYYY